MMTDGDDHCEMAKTCTTGASQPGNAASNFDQTISSRFGRPWYARQSHQTPAEAASIQRPNTTHSTMLDTRGWRVSGSAWSQASCWHPAEKAPPSCIRRITGNDNDSRKFPQALLPWRAAEACSQAAVDLRTSGLNSLVIVTENGGIALLWGTNPRRYRKTSTHPEEATYPCCIPALGSWVTCRHAEALAILHHARTSPHRLDARVHGERNRTPPLCVLRGCDKHR